MSKNPIFQERKKMSKTPIKKKFEKFYSQIHCKKKSKNFGHFLVVKIMSHFFKWKSLKKFFFEWKIRTRREWLKRKYVI